MVDQGAYVPARTRGGEPPLAGPDEVHSLTEPVEGAPEGVSDVEPTHTSTVARPADHVMPVGVAESVIGHTRRQSVLMGRSSRGLRMLFGGAAGVIVLAGLRAVSDVAGAAFLALTLTIAVSPLRSWLRRRNAPLWVIVAVPLLVVVLILIALLASVVV